MKKSKKIDKKDPEETSEKIDIMVHQNQDTIMEELQENQQSNSLKPVLNEDFDAAAYLSEYEMHQNALENERTLEKQKQKWRLQERLRRRLNPKYNDQILTEQIAATSVEMSKLDLETEKENRDLSSEAYKNQVAARNIVIFSELEKLKTTPEVTDSQG
jgi:hypothetical protein